MRFSREILESVLGRLTPVGKNLQGRCPYCGADEFVINSEKENHPFCCNKGKRCGVTGNIYTLLQHLGRTDLLGERRVNIFAKLTPLTVIDDSPTTETPAELLEIGPPPMWARVYEDPYLRSRGFTDEQFVKHEVGRSRVYPDYVTFLIRQRGRLVAYLGRSDKDKATIDAQNEIRKKKGIPPYLRYRNSPSDFGKMLGGLDELTENTTTVILTEGIFSKTKTDVNLQLDFDESIKCCYTFGAKITEDQLTLLLSFKNLRNVYLWFEADVLAKVKTTAAHLAQEYEVRVGYLDKVDPGNLTPEQAIYLFENSIDWYEYMTRYMKSDLKV